MRSLGLRRVLLELAADIQERGVDGLDVGWEVWMKLSLAREHLVVGHAPEEVGARTDRVVAVLTVDILTEAVSAGEPSTSAYSTPGVRFWFSPGICCIASYYTTLRVSEQSSFCTVHAGVKEGVELVRCPATMKCLHLLQETVREMSASASRSRARVGVLRAHEALDCFCRRHGSCVSASASLRDLGDEARLPILACSSV